MVTSSGSRTEDGPAVDGCAGGRGGSGPTEASDSIIRAAGRNGSEEGSGSDSSALNQRPLPVIIRLRKAAKSYSPTPRRPNTQSAFRRGVLRLSVGSPCERGVGHTSRPLPQYASGGDARAISPPADVCLHGCGAEERRRRPAAALEPASPAHAAFPHRLTIRLCAPEQEDEIARAQRRRDEAALRSEWM